MINIGYVIFGIFVLQYEILILFSVLHNVLILTNDNVFLFLGKFLISFTFFKLSSLWRCILKDLELKTINAAILRRPELGPSTTNRTTKKWTTPATMIGRHHERRQKDPAVSVLPVRGLIPRRWRGKVMSDRFGPHGILSISPPVCRPTPKPGRKGVMSNRRSHHISSISTNFLEKHVQTASLAVYV